MTALYTAQVVMPLFTGAPSDVITNTFHVAGEDSTTAAECATQLADPVIANGPSLARFYRAAYTVTPANLVPWVNWLGIVVRVFDQGDPPPRVPAIAAMPFPAQGTATVANMPTEVAACLSYSAAPVSGTPTARMRNRIFLGALHNAWFTVGSASAFPTLESTKRTTIVNAFVDELEAGSDFFQLVQRSDAGGVTAIRPITQVWMDNSPDSQRRRTVNPSGRTSDLAGPWGTAFPPDGP